MYGYLYKIIFPEGAFKKNGKPYYIGRRKIYPGTDNYYGSGIMLIRWITSKIKRPYHQTLRENEAKQIGLEKQILGFYKDSNSLDKAEIKMLETCLKDGLCINIRKGGLEGGLSRFELSKQTKEKISKAVKGRHWYNNGKIQIDIKGKPPRGFKKGKLPEMPVVCRETMIVYKRIDSNVLRVCRTGLTARGFHWRFATDREIGIFLKHPGVVSYKLNDYFKDFSEPQNFKLRKLGRAHRVRCIETNEVFQSKSKVVEKYRTKTDPRGHLYKAIKNRTSYCDLHFEVI